MEKVHRFGQIVILNGAPRSGKSSIVKVIQATFPDPWLNLGVDSFKECIHPKRYSPSIGLRPGGERPDLEPLITVMYAAMYESIAAHSRLGLNVVTDVGHHDFYSKPLGILPECARRLKGLPVLFVGVRCPINAILERRRNTWGGTNGTEIPDPVKQWQEEVHRPGIYDLEIDTSVMTPEEAAAVILKHLKNGQNATAFQGLAKLANSNNENYKN